MNNQLYWEKIVSEKPNKKLIFIHTPKCGGTYASKILNDLNIVYRGHKQGLLNEEINFTIVREPVNRFESLLNYRLSEDPRSDFPKHLLFVYDNENITLDEIVTLMSDEEILGFSPYNTLTYWSKNVDIFIKIDQLHEFLRFFGYDYDENHYKPEKISKKIRGKFSDETRKRIAELFNDDIIFYNKVITDETWQCL
jgi:hypothetical protein